MRTLKVKTGNAGTKFSSGWHTLEVVKAQYGDWNGTKYIDVWFKDYPESLNLPYLESSFSVNTIFCMILEIFSPFSSI